MRRIAYLVIASVMVVVPPTLASRESNRSSVPGAERGHVGHWGGYYGGYYRYGGGHGGWLSRSYGYGTGSRSYSDGGMSSMRGGGPGGGGK